MKHTFGLLVFAALTAGFLSNACGQWVQASDLDGAGTSSIVAIGSTLFIPNAPGLSLSRDNGSTWVTIDSAFLSPFEISAIATMGSNLYVAGSSYNLDGNSLFSILFRSTDLGGTWAVVDSGTDIVIPSIVTTGNSLVWSVNYSDLCDANLGGEIDVSFDSGSSSISTSPEPGAIRGPNIQSLGAHDSNIFAVVGDNFQNSFYQSTDLGSDWFALNTQILPSCFSFIGGNVFAGGGFGVYRSTDSSVTWDKVNIGLNDTNVAALATDGNRLFAATPSGIFFSNDLGTRWTNMSQGLPGHPNIRCLLVSGNFLFAGTDSLGIWERPLTDFPPVVQSGVKDGSVQSSSLANFPNPFSHSTAISFTSPEEGEADVTVVNLLGATVAQLYSGPLSIGNHSFAWSNPTVPDGTYECLIRLNGSIHTLPIVLTR